MLRRPLCCATLLLLAGCGSDSTNDSAGAANAPILCTFAFRPSDEPTPGQDPSSLTFTEHALTISPNEQVTFTLEGLTLDAHYLTDPYEGNVFTLNVVASNGSRLIGSLFQFGQAPPQNQFVGGHGFTGLYYLTHPTEGGDYQLWCAAAE